MHPESYLTAEAVIRRIQLHRRVEGNSAVLLPFTSAGQPDYDGLAAHLARTSSAGLIPAVNVDTGYVSLLTPAQRAEVLGVAQATLKGRPFVGGAYVENGEGPLVARYRREVELITEHGGTPILFQCSELTSLPSQAVVEVYRQAAVGPRLLVFELGRQFAPFGRIYDLDTVRRIVEIEAIVGLKHSSLDRQLEWQRLELRDRVRPEFKIYTGNDLAIDMVMYGSDYLLGLSTFSPEAFALRDRLWVEGDSRFYALNDLLQYLGQFAFRKPIPAYKHSAAQFLRLVGRIADDSPPPGALRRPDSDCAILADIAEQINTWLDER